MPSNQAKRFRRIILRLDTRAHRAQACHRYFDLADKLWLLAPKLSAGVARMGVKWLRRMIREASERRLDACGKGAA